MTPEQEAECRRQFDALLGYKVWDSFRKGFEAGMGAAVDGADDRDPGDEA